MDLTSQTTIKKLLLKYQTKASKGLGQNFLIDKNVLEKIINAGEIKKDDTILEVGPGIGTLTQELAARAGQVIAVEKSQAMLEILEETLKDFTNTEIIHGDILKLNPKPYTLHPYKLVANIPYYITSPLIRQFLEIENKPAFMVLMLQKEVAQRICAKPGDMSLLAVSVQFYADAKIISYVSKNCFWPAPKVDSAIIKITPHPSSPLSPNSSLRAERSNLFFKVVKAGFSQPRKQLVNNLSKTLGISRAQTEDWLKKNNISPSQRAETLSVDDWKHLVGSLQPQ
jgi:16S rRNA (adenine1518-N6/adenine1519-N6)-dimethyltransferase